MAEGNEVKWRGVRPTNPVENLFFQLGAPSLTEGGVTREFIQKSAELINNQVVIHTVTAGKIFYLCSATISVDSALGNTTMLYVRNVADTVLYRIFDFRITNAAPNNNSVSFNPPIPIQAGFDIVAITTSPLASAFIHGWEQ